MELDTSSSVPPIASTSAAAAAPPPPQEVVNVIMEKENQSQFASGSLSNPFPDFLAIPDVQPKIGEESDDRYSDISQMSPESETILLRNKICGLREILAAARQSHDSVFATLQVYRQELEKSKKAHVIAYLNAKEANAKLDAHINSNIQNTQVSDAIVKSLAASQAHLSSQMRANEKTLELMQTVMKFFVAHDNVKNSPPN